MTVTEFNRYTEFAKRIAVKAGSIIRSAYKQDISIDWKDNNSPVTEVDRQIDALVISEIRQAFPDHNVITEEGGNTNNQSRYTWLCDPIDGTVAFIAGIPTSVFSLALVEAGRSVFSLVYDPFLERVYCAAEGRGAFVNGIRLRVSEHNSIKNARIGLTVWASAAYDSIPMISKLTAALALPVNVTSSQYMGALVAAGKLQGLVYFDDKPHDAAAIKVLIEEAGGVVTDLFGNDQDYDKPVKGCIAAPPLIHRELVRFFVPTQKSLQQEKAPIF